MEIDKSFIINNMFYMTISLTLKLEKNTIMSPYGSYSYYMPVNMSDFKKASSAYIKIEISYPYLLLSDAQFALLNEDIDRNTIHYDHMYVQTTPLLLFRRTVTSTLLNMLMPRSLYLHIHFYIMIISL